jgi:hypothetical protein
MLRPILRTPIIAPMLLALMLTAPAAHAQNPDFSGTWVFNADKSILPQMGQQGGRGGAGGFGGAQGAGGEITIKVDGGTIIVSRQVAGRQGAAPTTREDRFTPNGQPVRSTDQRGMTTTTTASWSEGKLVVEATTSGDMGGRGSFSITTRSTYSLRDNGRLLVIDQVRSNPMGGGETTSSLAYDKKP